MDNSGKNEKLDNNIFAQKSGFTNINTNPFSTNYNKNETKPEPTNHTTNPIKRLNGYDSAILNQTNFDDTNTEDLSIEYRIKDKETQIKDLDAKIKSIENYGTQSEAFTLRAKRQRILQELDTLRKQQLYGGRVLGESTKLTHDSLKTSMPTLYKIQDFVSREILARLSKKVKSVVTLTDSLEQLSQISKSIDELTAMNVPYGEKLENYEKLTDYLNQANLIHSKISKSLGRN